MTATALRLRRAGAANFTPGVRSSAPAASDPYAHEYIIAATVTTAAMLELIDTFIVMLSRLTGASGADAFFWPLIFRGVGLGLMFVPLTNATMVDLSARDLAQGAGMFNLFRQLGGSLGIAILATALARFRTVQIGSLTEHVGTSDPATLARFGALSSALVSHGVNPFVAKSQAVAIVQRQIAAQAGFLAFSRIYLYSGLGLVAAPPLLLLFRTGKAQNTFTDLH